MKRKDLNLSIEINATKEKVWHVLLDDTYYRLWAATFYPGSYAETDWQEGSKAYFKSPEGDGMVSKIAVHRPKEIISIHHLGIIKNGKEEFDSDEAKEWGDLTETYRLSENNGKTTLHIEQEIGENYADDFTESWQKALQKIKELSEEGIKTA